MTLIVLYDVARLIRRARFATPTGIDRVDLRYLEYFLQRHDTTVQGVTQCGNRLVAVSSRELDRLRAILHARWLGAGSSGHGAVRSAVRLKWGLQLRGLRSRLWRLRPGPAAKRQIDSAIIRLCRRVPEAEVIYVNTSHSGIREQSLFEALRSVLSARVAVYVHDMIPVDFPEYVRPGFDLRHAELMKNVARSADLVLTNSAYSRDRFAEFCAAQGLAVPRTEVVNIGVEPSILARASTGNPADPAYFVAVGTLEPRKNLSLLLRVWQSLRDRGGEVPQLRLIGRRGWETEVNRDFEALLGTVAGDVVELGALPDGDLIGQIAGARALLFPSFVEGWGMPLVEAQTIGTPVIGSDIDAFREASQGLATLLPPDDPAAWEAGIRDHMPTGTDSVPEAQARLEGFRPPTWESHFERLETVLAGHIR